MAFYHVIHFDLHGALLTYEQMEKGVESNIPATLERENPEPRTPNSLAALQAGDVKLDTKSQDKTESLIRCRAVRLVPFGCFSALGTALLLYHRAHIPPLPALCCFQQLLNRMIKPSERARVFISQFDVNQARE